MSSTSRAAYASIALLLVACGPSIQVHTMAEPAADLSALHTFRILPGPARRDGRPVTGADDPMINNSIANRALREQIVKGFEDGGYVLGERDVDFAVAFYATARQKLDVTVWDYGYPFTPGWRHFPGQMQSVTQYTEGSVIIDVVRPGSGELLWRGEGKAELSDDPTDNVKQLAKAASAIVKQFPRATARVVAARP